jgi:hypothetical protein
MKNTILFAARELTTGSTALWRPGATATTGTRRLRAAFDHVAYAAAAAG